MWQNHEFTDVNRFSIRCLECRKAFVGQVRAAHSEGSTMLLARVLMLRARHVCEQREAQTHAQSTGHQRFGEVR